VLDLTAVVAESFLGLLAVPCLEVSGATLETQVSHLFFNTLNTDDWQLIQLITSASGRKQKNSD